MSDRLKFVIAQGARRWSDDAEAISGLLCAADVLPQALGQRRRLARDLVARKFSASDVLTWICFHVEQDRSPQWMRAALKDAESVSRARSMGATERVCGPVNEGRRASIDALVHRTAGARTSPIGHLPT